MNRIIVVIFDNEKHARRGVKYLEILDYDGAITLFATAVIKKNAEGHSSVVQVSDGIPLGTGVGTLSGLLFGALGGPVGVAVGILVGSLRGISCDLAHLGVNRKFLEKVDQHLSPGKVALVAEILEEHPSLLDARMKPPGVIVLRQPSAQGMDSQMTREFAALDSEFSTLETEFSNANDRAKQKLETRLDAAKARLYVSHEKAKALVEEAKREIEAKGSLNDLIAAAHFHQNDRFEEWISEKQIEFERRINELGNSWERSQKAAENSRYAQTHF